MSKAARLPNATSEDNFEAEMEGVPENFGSIDDWETEAILKMRKLERGQSSHTKLDPDAGEELVERKLALYKCVLQLMSNNPKLAMQLGNKGGFSALMGHVLKKSVHYAAEREMEPYARAMQSYLPGAKVAALQHYAISKGGFADPDKAKKAMDEYIGVKEVA